MSSVRRPATLLDSLSLLSSGGITVTVGGSPVVSIRSDEREVDVEVKGAREAGLSLSKVVRLQVGRGNILEGSEQMAKKLSSLGWRLTLYDEGTKILTMGRGVSRLTGRINASPLKLKKLLDALR